MRRRLEEALAAEAAEDRLLEQFLSGLRELPPERAARVLSRAVPEYRRAGRDSGVAKRRALARLETGFGLGWTPPASREEFYER